MSAINLAYIMITPAKDEENKLPALINSVVNQTLKPIAWFIVDDNSTDQTFTIVEDASKIYPWIHLLRLKSKHSYGVGKSYAWVCINGFNWALSCCKENNLEFNFIALSDADAMYPSEYFDRCIKFLYHHSQYGIISGRMLVGKTEHSNYEENKLILGDGEPYGCGRIWRKETFFDTKGYQLVKSPDAVSNIKALIKGWKIKRLKTVKFYQTRGTGEKDDVHLGYFNRGARAYYLGVNPLAVFNDIVDMLLISKQPNALIKSFALLHGYMNSFSKKEEQITDIEVKQYCSSYKRIIRSYCLFIMNSMFKN